MKGTLAATAKSCEEVTEFDIVTAVEASATVTDTACPIVPVNAASSAAAKAEVERTEVSKAIELYLIKFFMVDLLDYF